MERPIVNRGDLAPPERSRLWWCAWRKRTGIGGIGESRVHCPIWDTKCPQHDRANPGTARNRARAGEEPEDDMEGVSEPALGADCGHRLLHRGSVDRARTAAVYHSVLHRLVYAEGVEFWASAAVHECCSQCGLWRRRCKGPARAISSGIIWIEPTTCSHLMFAKPELSPHADSGNGKNNTQVFDVTNAVRNLKQFEFSDLTRRKQTG
jgi:hypothetical protein